MSDLYPSIATATAALLKASLGSSSDSTNSTENHPNCSSDDRGTRGRDASNRIMPVRDKIKNKDRQRDLTAMIVNFTMTLSEDIRPICDRASATEVSAKEATEALCRVFKSGDPSQQLSATRLWAHFLLYSPVFFSCQCAKPEFLDALEDVLNSRSTFQIVRECLLHVLAGAVYSSSRTSYQGVSGLGVLWRKVKSAEEPDEGVPFYQDDAMTNFLSRRNTENKSKNMRIRWNSGEGDHALSVQLMACSVQRLVECRICMDSIPVGSIIHVDSCGHTFCRKCLHGYMIAACVDGLTFPIHCPACTADKGKGKETTSDLNFGRADSYPPSMRSYSQDDSLHATAASSEMDSIQTAMRLQREFDDEDFALSLQRAELVNFDEPLFECSICMDDIPMDSIALVDSCGHTFCRECLRGHVAARLEERVFPVRCPTCTADKGRGKEQTGEVSQSLALELGLTVEQFNIWTEMEMAEFSILMHCRRCERSMFVARDEHDAVNVLACPLSDCDHIWCKHCQQSIDPNGPRHSCDGTSELEHLVKEQGWKYCPSCKTPIQKTSGCNHMKCITSACNTHFCYLCGGLIVKSVSSREIERATSNHYKGSCNLFEVVPE